MGLHIPLDLCVAAGINLSPVSAQSFLHLRDVEMTRFEEEALELLREMRNVLVDMNDARKKADLEASKAKLGKPNKNAPCPPIRFT